MKKGIVTNTETVGRLGSGIKRKSKWQAIKKNYDLYIFLLPTVLYFLIFRYGPMYGIQIAFKDFIATHGIWGSPWVGFEHFRRFFNSFQFKAVLINTIALSFYTLFFGFWPPILLALMLNQVGNEKFKRFVQTVTYAPHFISVVVVVSMLFAFLALRNGLVNIAIRALGGEAIDFMGSARWFRTIYVLSDIWQNMGWSSIIYIAALSGISPELHEAAIIDGANRIQRIWHIEIPGILPTIIILLILRSGSIMNVGFQKVFLMQTPLNMSVSQVISTYVYQIGLINADFSFATAVDLFNSVINFAIIITVNAISRRLSETSLW
ncbi:MAG: sugar ABC transporter permease [Clostridia bacterium]|nr:sugar ABC transporter permease [Clostridia bacterium]